MNLLRPTYELTGEVATTGYNDISESNTSRGSYMKNVVMQVRLNPELRKRARVQSLVQGLTLSDFVVKAVESALALTEPKPSKK